MAIFIPFIPSYICAFIQMYIHTLQSTAMISCIYLTSVTYTGQGPARSEASPRTHTFGSVAGADCHLDACGVCVCVRVRARACMPVRACVRACVCVFAYVCEYMMDSYQTELNSQAPFVLAAVGVVLACMFVGALLGMNFCMPDVYVHVDLQVRRQKEARCLSGYPVLGAPCHTCGHYTDLIAAMCPQIYKYIGTYIYQGCRCLWAYCATGVSLRTTAVSSPSRSLPSVPI